MHYALAHELVIMIPIFLQLSEESEARIWEALKKCFQTKSNLSFLFLNVTIGLHLVVNRLLTFMNMNEFIFRMVLGQPVAAAPIHFVQSCTQALSKHCTHTDNCKHLCLLDFLYLLVLDLVLDTLYPLYCCEIQIFPQWNE